MPITGGKSKSRPKRKPLRDVSNAGLKRPLTHSVMKKFNPQQSPTTCARGDPIDRLLLVHSDLSALIHKIDELVVQALEKEVRNEKEIESFTHVLHELQNSLKPWVSRFQNILPARAIGSNSQLETSLASMKITPSVNEETSKNLVSPYVDKFDLLVSPSPLVSWRADCAADGGRNLFLLTPLPKRTPFSSKLKNSSTSVFEKLTSDVTVGPARPVADKFNIAINEKTAVEIAASNVTVRPVGPVADNIHIAINEKTSMENVFSSPEKVVRRNDSIFVSTPYVKMSPPKSCKLLEPSSEWCNKINGTKKRHVDPVGGGSGDSDPSVCQLPSGHLALKYPELFGIRPASKMGNSRKVVEASPNWCMLMSPPKTCVLLEPSDDDQIKDVETKLKKDDDIPRVVSCKKVIDSTPMCKDLDTTILKGKRAGENTLKKELWTRFEAATAHGFHFKPSFDQETGNDSGTNKGFLDLLEEVSRD